MRHRLLCSFFFFCPKSDDCVSANAIVIMEPGSKLYMYLLLFTFDLCVFCDISA